MHQKQLQLLSTHASVAVYDEVVRLDRAIAQVPAASRLPLAGMAVAALRQLNKDQYQIFRQNAFDLASADQEITLSEYALLRMIARNLDPLFGLSKRPTVQYKDLASLTAECAVALSTLAWAGNTDPKQAAQAFANGAAELQAGAALNLLPEDQCSLDAADKALDKLMLAAAPLKERIVAASVACVSSDGKVTIEEAELLRAVADSLECPIPPFLPQAA